jgi:hypothetical protein
LTLDPPSTKVDVMVQRVEIPAAEDTELALAAVVALRRLANQLERRAVDHAIDQGWTWAQIGQALGVSAQAAHKKLARRPARENR